ncbi:fibronectin type III domain-containing protein [Brumimicrobium mesophilum]|uniref:fibronectin type III domain-containing protein n=1 Tax=Brumimicrobium mesophilum TaxID=392717 RepID=UPI000D14042B|nr:T9SS type A sorting domain-containing protein [Brumimicrobium mesophilum]
MITKKTLAVITLGLLTFFHYGKAVAQCTPVLAPFNENFDGLALTSPYTALPSCWGVQTGPDYWDVTNDVTNGPQYLPNIGDHTTGTSNFMWIDASTDITANEMVTPDIDMSGLTTPYVGFWFASDNVDNAFNHTINLDAWDGTAWVNITSLVGNFSSWVEVAGTLPAGVPTTTKFRIYATPATGTTSANYYQNDLGVDDFFVMEAPTCFKTTNELTTNVTAVSADISWSHTVATSFEVTYDVTGFTPGTSVNSSILSSNSTTLIGLNPITNYDWYVRAICAPGDTSDWSNASSFKTLCSSLTAPYYNGFEFDALDLAPDCWGFYNTTSGFVEVEDFTGTAAPYSGSQALYLYNGSSSTIGADTLIAITPQFTDLIGGDKRIRFQANADNVTTRLIVGTIAAPIPSSTFNPIDTVTFLADDTYQQVIVNLDAANGYNGSDEYIVFGHELGGGTLKYIRIDDFNYEVIPSCLSPSNVMTNSILATTASLTWTENGSATSWEVDYGLSGYTAGTGTSSVESVSSANLTGLSAFTDYDVYVRAICSPGDTSAWSLISSFTTTCLPYTAPYYNGFENDDLDLAPGCWDSYVTINNGFVEVEDFTGTAAPFAGAQALYLYNGSGFTVGSDTLKAISPNFSDLTAGDKRIRFQANADNVTTRLIIGTVPSEAPTAVFTPVDTVTFLADDTYQEVITYFDAANGYNGTDQYIAFIHELDGGTLKYIRIDDFNYEVSPSCIAPTNLMVNSILATSANLSWTQIGSPIEWEVEYGVSGFTLGSGTNSIETTSTPSLTGLNDDTAYDLYVRAICAPGDTSDWSNITTFSTPCNAFLAPFIENFDGLALVSPYTDLPNCWEPQTLADDWDVTNDVVNTGHAYLPNIGDHTTGTGNYMWIDASTDILANEMVTPFIDMSALTTPLIGFWFASNNVDNAINHTISLDAWDGNAWVNITTESGNFPGWTEVSGPLPAGVPTIAKFRIQAIAATGTTSSNYFQNDLGIDDFFVMETPSCPDPSALTAANITGTSADLSWTENGTATTYNVEYGISGFTPGTGTIVAGVSNPFTLNALTSCSDYEYYVQSDCSAGLTSAMVGPFTFSTLNAPVMETDVIVACETYTWRDGLVYTSSNNTATFTVVGASVNGCDSLYSLDLTINNATTGTDAQVACETYTWIDGTTYTASNNTATFTLIGGAATGCDSIVTLDLTINNAASGTDTQVACEMYTWIDGNDYTASNNTATFSITGGAANGCDSIVTLDLTINNSVTGTDVQEACNSFTWIDGVEYTMHNNTATFTIVGGAANGCDSIVTLDLTINTVDVTTTQTNGIDLSANAVGAMYQWIDCDNGNAPLPGETNKDYTAMVNGNYAVIVTENGCTDTSTCIMVDNVGLEDIEQTLGVSLYPNPTDGAVTVLFENNMEGNQYSLEVIDATARKLAKQNITDNSTLVDLSTYERGVYIIRISNGKSESIHRVVKK